MNSEPAASLRIEHVNVTVSDAERTAALLGRLFGWRIRWQGAAQGGGRSVHVGTADHYLALYAHPGERPAGTWRKGVPLNHIGVEVADLDAAAARAEAAGLRPFNHSDYGSCRSFYLFDPDGIEFEVVSYAASAPAGA